MAKMTALKAPDLYDHLAILVDPATVITNETETSFTATNGGVQVIVGLDADGNLTSLNVRTHNGIQYLTAYNITGLSVDFDTFSALLAINPYQALALLFQGKDTVVGSGFDDDLTGFRGRDKISGGDGDDWLEGEAGADTLVGGDDDDTIIGGAGKDVVLGGKGSDFISGDPGKDQFDGGKGQDVVDYRGLGEEEALVLTLNGAAPAVAKIGGVKADTLKNIEIILAGNGDDRVTGSDRAESFRGDSGDDRLSGKGGNDYLHGGYDKDRLDGGTGKDELDGAEGNDTLTGGQGADVFVFREDIGSDNVDKITDFQVGVDRINLSHFIFDKLSIADTLDPDFFQVGLADDSDDYIIYLPGTGELYYDFDGSGIGIPVHFATVGKNLALSASDFIVT